VRSIAGLRAEPLEESAQRIEGGEHRPPAQPLARALTDLFGQFVLEADGLLNVEPFEVAMLGVGFELGERSRRTIDGVLAEAPSLIQIDEIVALDALILRVVHPAPAPSHSLGKGRHIPLVADAAPILGPSSRQTLTHLRLPRECPTPRYQASLSPSRHMVPIGPTGHSGMRDIQKAGRSSPTQR